MIGEHRCVDEARADGVDPDPLGRESHRHRAGQPEHPGLRRRVGGVDALGDDAVDRRDAHDRGVGRVGPQLRQERLHHHRVGAQVDLEQRVPRLVGELGQVDRVGDAGRVHQPADGADRRRGLVRGLLQRVGLAHVDGHADRLHPVRSGDRVGRRRRPGPGGGPRRRPGRPTSATACAVARPIPDAPPVITTPDSGCRSSAAMCGPLPAAPVAARTQIMPGVGDVGPSATRSPHDRDLPCVHRREDRRRVPPRGHRADASTTCPPATWSSTWSGRASTTRTRLAATEKGRVARISPSVPGIDLAGTVRESNVAGVAAGRRGHRPRLRPRRLAPRRVRPGRAGPRRSGSCPCPTASRPVRRCSWAPPATPPRCRCSRCSTTGSSRRRAPCSSPGRPEASAAWRWRCSPVSGSRSPPSSGKPDAERRSSAGSAPERSSPATSSPT